MEPVSTLDTTKQRMARLGEIAVWLATAHDLLEQACAAVYDADRIVYDVVPRDVRLEIAKAEHRARLAAREITVLAVKAQY